MRRKYLNSIVLLTIVFTMLASTLTPIFAQSDEETRAIELVSAVEDVSAFLATYPDWEGHAYQQDETVWYVDFFDVTGEEWIGYGIVDLATEEVRESFVPAPLPADEYATLLPLVELVALEDPEVLGLLKDPVLWDIYTDYNRYDQVWDVYCTRGVTQWLVRVYAEDENSVYISEIVNPNVLTEEEALSNARSSAVSLAYEGEGIDVALEGHDNWTTYAENQGGPVWSVAFVVEDEELYYALVNIESWEILEFSVRGS